MSVCCCLARLNLLCGLGVLCGLIISVFLTAEDAEARRGGTEDLFSRQRTNATLSNLRAESASR